MKKKELEYIEEYCWKIPRVSCPICGQSGGEVTPALNDTEAEIRPYFYAGEVSVVQHCTVCKGEWVMVYRLFDIKVKEDETI